MKTMTEIVQSIKNEELRAFATKLQQKLEQARTAIVSKRKKVSGAEQSALRNSVSTFTERNRGKLPQKVAGLLALTMLTTMLASCDEFGKPGHHRPHDTKEPTIEDTVEPEIPQYEHLEIEEFTGEPLDPKQCGLRAFSNFDFGNSFGGGSFSKTLEDKFTYFLSDAYDESPMLQKELFTTLALWSYVDEDYGRDNVEIDINYVFNSDWTHKIVSTQNDFALISKSPSGELFITGFTSGKFKNELGLVNQSSIRLLAAVAKTSTYGDILNYSRKEFFGQVFQLSFGESVDVYPGAVTTDIYGNKIPVENLDCRINYIYFRHSNGGALAKATVNEGIPENYIDQLLEQESIIEIPTEKDTDRDPERTRPVEDFTENPDAIPPHYKEDYTEDNNYYYEEETTGAGEETEAEIEPEPEVTFGVDPE